MLQHEKIEETITLEDMVSLERLPFNSSRRNCDVPLVLLERS